MLSLLLGAIDVSSQSFALALNEGAATVFFSAATNGDLQTMLAGVETLKTPPLLAHSLSVLLEPAMSTCTGTDGGYIQVLREIEY